MELSNVNEVVAGPTAMFSTNSYPMDAWNWERYFNSAKSILEITVEEKGEMSVTRRVDSSDYMQELSRQLCEHLLLLAIKTISKVETLNN